MSQQHQQGQMNANSSTGTGDGQAMPSTTPATAAPAFANASGPVQSAAAQPAMTRPDGAGIQAAGPVFRQQTERSVLNAGSLLVPHGAPDGQGLGAVDAGMGKGNAGGQGDGTGLPDGAANAGNGAGVDGHADGNANADVGDPADGAIAAAYGGLVVDPALGGADPAINARLFAAGFSPDQAQLVYDLAADILAPAFADLEQAGRRAADRAVLSIEFGGAENWKNLAPKIEKWGRENLPEAAFEQLCQSAEGVRSLYRLMRGAGEPALAQAGRGDGAVDLRADLRRKMNDPRYWRDRDPALVADVQAGFSRLYPSGDGA